MNRVWVLAAMGLVGCASTLVVEEDTDTDSDGSTTDDDMMSTTTTTTTTTTTSSTTDAPTSTTTLPPTSTTTPTSGTDTDPTGDVGACEDGDCLVDIVVVVDNSGTMALEQAQLGAAMLPLGAGLEELGYDVQVMFTTTDFGNPTCTPFKPDGYSPARGAPTTSACVDRIDDFTGLGSNPDVVPEACSDSCPEGVAPADDPFIAFGLDGDNIPDGVPASDVDGDGVVDSAAAKAMACLAPQGINGCGFESPLETMAQALNPAAAWNGGNRPFLRDGSTLGVVIVTDEADCSIRDFTVMEDEQFQEINPNTGNPGSSSAICWNAGVDCVGPDANGIYSECVSNQLDFLQPVSRYTDLLVTQLRDVENHDVVMLGVVGVPAVGQFANELPGTPISGGVFDLVYRDWQDGTFPEGDVLPDEAQAGVTAANKAFDFGIGPGCTGGSAANGFTGQAIPPVRLREVCESLNEGDEVADVRCCLSSVCDGDFEPAMDCLLGMIEHVTEG